MSLFEIKGERITLAILTPEEAELAIRYYAANRTHLEPWEPARDDSFYSVDETRRRLEKSMIGFREEPDSRLRL